MSRELTDKEMAVIDKVEKLLRLASGNANEHEASAASEMAMKLLEAYNLDMMILEKNSGKTGKRTDTKFVGGLYPWQRQLWYAVADLHFCKYWYVRGLRKGEQYQHRVLGRHENVVSSRMMAEYLQQAIERLAREWAGDPKNYFTKSAVSYRDGMSHRIVDRLRDKRRERLAEDERKRRETARTGGAPGTALVLVDVIQAEEDANNDHLYGEGWSARTRAARAQANKDYEIHMAAQRKWREENPEEAARQDAETKARNEKWAKEEARKASRRKGVERASANRYKGDADAFWEGHAKGADVGLDQQVSHNPTRGVK